MLLSTPNLVPDGRAGTGAAYVLRPDTSAPKSIEGAAGKVAAMRAAAEKLRAAEQQKQEDAAAKEYADKLGYNTKTGRLFQATLDGHVYPQLQKEIRDLYLPTAGVSRYDRQTKSAELLSKKCY